MTIEIIVVADGPDIGSGGQHPDRLSIAEKEMCRNIADTLTVGAAGAGLAGGLIGLAGPELWGPAAFALVASAGMAIGAVGFNRLADDPPDEKFAAAVRVELLAMRAPSAPATRDLQPLLNVFNDLLVTVPAVTTAYERAQGAADAGDLRWNAGHAHGARVLRGVAASDLLQLAHQITTLVETEFLETTLDEAGYLAVKERAARHALYPQRITQLFTDSGVPGDDLSEGEILIANLPQDSFLLGTAGDVTRDLARELASLAARLPSE